MSHDSRVRDADFSLMWIASHCRQSRTLVWFLGHYGICRGVISVRVSTIPGLAVVIVSLGG